LTAIIADSDGGICISMTEPEPTHLKRPPTRPRYRLRHDGREIEVPPTGLLIGRAPECNIRLAGGLVSRRHAALTVSGDALMVEDLGSRNGVVVNQRKITEPTKLTHGDTVGVGVEVFEVLDDHVISRPAHLSTLPPIGIAPPGESDVDAPQQQVTVVARLDILSDREREVLELIVLGHTQKEIAESLHVSVKTVETHRARLADKLGCKTRAELVSYAISAGLLRGR
jgi:DNA-binding CsgD family transcriptional regulator